MFIFISRDGLIVLTLKLLLNESLALEINTDKNRDKNKLPLQPRVPSTRKVRHPPHD